MEYITKNASETKKLGKRLSADLKGRVVALEGDLGAGKTTFVQGIAEGLGIKSRVNSPTFIILRSYESEKLNLYHVDLYRIEKNIKQEIQEIGLTDLWKDSKNTIVVEWANRAKDYLPQNAVWIKIENIGENKRKIIINHE